jgi:hypothetical protein
VDAATAASENESVASSLQRAMGEIIQAAVQVKELQRDHQASIDNLRQQYF